MDDAAMAKVVSARSAAHLLAAAAAAMVGCAAVGVVVGLRIAHDGSESAGENAWVVAWLLVGSVHLLVGTVLLSRYRYRRLGICLQIVGGAALVLAVSTQASFAVDDGVATRWAAVADARWWAHPIATGVLAALLPWEFVTSGRKRRLEIVWWGTAVCVMLLAIGTGLDGEGPGVDSVDVLTVLVGASATAATARLVAVWWRLRYATDDPLLAWLAAGSVAVWLAVVPEWLEYGWEVPGGDVAGSLLLLATVPLFLVGAIVSALRRRAIRFRGLTHDVIGWLVLAGAIAVVYTAVVAGLGKLVGGSGPTWLLVAATGVIAIGLEPARRRLHAAVDRLVWGARHEPMRIVSEVVDHVDPDSGEDLLPALVATLQRDLRLDAVAIDVRTTEGWRREAAVGPPTAFERTVDLTQHGEVLGRLVVGWGPRSSLRSRDEQMLAELAGPLALAVGWARLAAELRRSSVQIVAAREEERRRIRRDLHDGLGPSLTGVSLGVRTAIRQLQRAGEGVAAPRAYALLDHVADEVDTLVDEVKRIVRDLRPTALDQFGLVEAVTEFAHALADELTIELSLPETPVRLPAAVEIATYRIVTEALTNVVRHARALRCWLTISVGSTVDIEVTDDGIGLADRVSEGVGFAAMRERAGELGGVFDVSHNMPRGTRIHVRLPVAALS